LHAGSCLGIAWALRRDLRALTARDAGLVLATSIPAAVAGSLAADAVEERLGTRGQLAALLAGAGLLLWVADRRPEQTGIGAGQAAAAAVAQVAALAPGVSRSGAALTTLRGLGVRRAEAQRFSLLMSLPVTAGAAGLTLLRADRRTLRALAGPLAAGIPAAAVVAAGLTAGEVRRGGISLRAAALYRLGLAAVVAVRSKRENQ
jgi:undecaprenyl-diphosphatase